MTKNKKIQAAEEAHKKAGDAFFIIMYDKRKGTDQEKAYYETADRIHLLMRMEHERDEMIRNICIANTPMQNEVIAQEGIYKDVYDKAVAFANAFIELKYGESIEE